jgi:uncharacterized membrane protein YiaA
VESSSLLFETMGPTPNYTHFILKSTKVIHWIATVLELVILCLGCWYAIYLLSGYFCMVVVHELCGVWSIKWW